MECPRGSIYTRMSCPGDTLSWDKLSGGTWTSDTSTTSCLKDYHMLTEQVQSCSMQACMNNKEKP